MPNEPNAVRRFVRSRVRVCHEAGACGYALQRQVTTPRVSCRVLTPALIRRKSGERIKTIRRDARKLAERLRAGLPTQARAPTPEEEASAIWVGPGMMPVKICSAVGNRLGKLLPRRRPHYNGRHWTRAPRQWLDHLDRPHRPSAWSWLHVLAIDHVKARFRKLDAIDSSSRNAAPIYWARTRLTRCAHEQSGP